MAKKSAYASAGVDLEVSNRLKDDLPTLLASTKRPEVLGEVGGFGGLFALNTRKYRNPVLVSSVDGVGTAVTPFEGSFPTVNEFDYASIEVVLPEVEIGDSASWNKAIQVDGHGDPTAQDEQQLILKNKTPDLQSQFKITVKVDKPNIASFSSGELEREFTTDVLTNRVLADGTLGPLDSEIEDELNQFTAELLEQVEHHSVGLNIPPEMSDMTFDFTLTVEGQIGGNQEALSTATISKPANTPLSDSMLISGLVLI